MVSELLDADALPGEHFTEIGLAVSEADAAAAGDRERTIVERLIDRIEAAVGTR